LLILADQQDENLKNACGNLFLFWEILRDLRGGNPEKSSDIVPENEHAW